MSEFKKSGGFGGNKGKQGFDRRDSGGAGYSKKPDYKRSGGFDKQKSKGFTASCDQCHKVCELPFRPNGRKPVYCRECFNDKKESSPSDYPRKESRDHGFAKRDTRPNFPAKPEREGKRIDELRKQIDEVNAKLDRLIQLADKPAVVVAEPVAATAAKTKAVTKTAKADKPKAIAKAKKAVKKVVAKVKPKAKAPAKKKK